MNSKNLVPIILFVVIVIVGILSFKFIFDGSSNTSDNGQISLSTNPSPPKIGQTTFTITVKDQMGKPVDNAKVSFDLNMTTMNMGVQRGEATSQGNGQYAATGRFSMGGPWGVQTKINMPDGQTINKNFTIDVY